MHMGETMNRVDPVLVHMGFEYVFILTVSVLRFHRNLFYLSLLASSPPLPAKVWLCR